MALSEGAVCGPQFMRRNVLTIGKRTSAAKGPAEPKFKGSQSYISAAKTFVPMCMMAAGAAVLLLSMEFVTAAQVKFIREHRLVL